MSHIVKMHSVECLGNELDRVRDQLEQYVSTSTSLSFQGSVIDAGMLLQFYKYVMELNRRKLRKHQQQGIEDALKRKSEGRGSYGRPKTVLPDDFEKQILLHIQNDIPLAEYQEEIKMKRSTFYKYANCIKGTMLTEDIDKLKQN